MAINFNLPTLSTAYSAIYTYIVDNIKAVATMTFTGASNIPDGCIRWSGTNKRFEIYTESTGTWGELSDYFNMTVTGLNNMSATVNELSSVCHNNTALAAEIVKSSDGIGVTIPRSKLVEIGDWDMDATASKYVAHGLDVTKIIGAIAIVRHDTDTQRFTLGNNPGTDDGYISGLNTTYVILERVASGDFDSTNFDSTGYNRGWVVLFYLT